MSHFKDTVHSKAPFSVRIVEFGCLHCGRRWSSANGSLEDYQKCKNCYTECYPVGCRIREPNKYGNENRQTLQGHNKELCGKCARLGRSCMMMDNESDNDTDDIDMYMKTIPQAHQLNTRKHHQDGNQSVTENYSLKQWPDLTTLALRYLPKPHAPSSSNRIRLTSIPNDVTSTGMTAAETLANAIQSARKKTADNVFDDFYIDGGYSEEEFSDNYQQDANAVDEIWDYKSFAFDQDKNDDCDELQYNNMLFRLDDKLDISDDDDKEEESNENEVFDFGDNDELEACFYQDDEDYSSSPSDKAYFDGMDDISSDDGFYTKQMSNRLLRRGRKHALQGRKNSWKVILN